MAVVIKQHYGVKPSIKQVSCVSELDGESVKQINTVHSIWYISIPDSTLEVVYVHHF